MFLKLLRRAGLLVLALVGLLVLLWAAGALFFDLPASPLASKIMAVLFLLVSLASGLFGRRKLRLIAPIVTLAVVAWWFTLKPSNDRDWLADVARPGWAEVDGDRVTLHNIRNCDYRTETDYTVHWETRAVDLSKITGIDLAINYWGSPYIAHPIVSFQFSDSPPVCFSIETRKEKGESYSAIGGLYRQYELIYIVAEERDVIRVRTNYRQDEDTYLYRLHVDPKNAREQFMEYVTTLNELRNHPRWYHAITSNCTTSIPHQPTQNQRPWDWRLLLNGKMDEMFYENGAIGAGNMPFAEFKRRSLVDDEAKAADPSPDFSRLIRKSAPSFKP